MMWGLSPKLMLQWGAAAIVGIVLVWTGYTVLGWKNDAAKVPGLEQEIKDHEATIKREREEVRKVQAASEGFQAELARLRAARPVGPAPTVRVCRDAPAPRVLASTAEPGPDAGAAAGGVLPPEPGPDIGSELYGAADRADELSAQIRGLQRYILEVCVSE